MSRFDDFLDAYFEAIYFTELGDLEQPPNHAELDYDSEMEQMFEAKEFYDKYKEEFKGLEEQAGHDFWLTRQGHGAGFWDRPEMYGAKMSEQLTDAAMQVGDVDELIWEVDGEIWEEDL